jgi:2'-5' RNA ligase
MQLLTEASKGCLLLPLWGQDAINAISWVQKNVKQECLAEDGIEREPHVTVLYGFVPSVNPEDVCDSVAGFGKVAFRLGKISRFEQDDHDMLKVDVEGETLHALHDHLLNDFEGLVEQTYPTYTPHMTLAYVKKGALKELDGHCHFDGQIFVFDLAVYSTPESKERYFAHLDA